MSPIYSHKRLLSRAFHADSTVGSRTVGRLGGVFERGAKNTWNARLAVQAPAEDVLAGGALQSAVTRIASAVEGPQSAPALAA
jgi:hypothetical protein